MSYRELHSLGEFNLAGAKNINILIGFRRRDVMDFYDDSGKPVHVDACYFVYRITNSVRESNIFGAVPKELKVSVEDFADIFGSEAEFMEKWAFRPVILNMDTDAKNNKLILYGCEFTSRYDIKK